MTITEDVRNTVDEVPDVLAVEVLELDAPDDIGQTDGASAIDGGRIARVARQIAPDKSVVGTGLAMSAACVGAVVLASTLHRGSPWAGINAITSGLGLDGRLARRGFDLQHTAVSLATIVVGSLGVAAIANKLTPARGIGRIGGGIIAGLGSFAVDRFLMRRQLVPALRHSLGPIGTVVKYGAIGLGAILGRRVG